MLMNKPRTLKQDVLYYFSGALVIALGVVMLIKSTLGVGPWDSFFVTLARISPLTIGTSAIVALFTLTALVMVLRRQMVFAFILIPIFLVGLLIDFFDLIVLAEFTPEGFLRVLAFAFGMLAMPLGGAMLMQTRFPAGVFEELMLLIMDRFNIRRMATARLWVEVFPVLGTLLINWLMFQDIGALSYGTVVYVLAAGPLVQFYNKRLRRTYDEQTD